MDREVDMINTGKRHPYVGMYKVRVTQDGVFKAYECDLVSNAGCSYDMSPFIMELSVYRCLDNCYFFPMYKATGKLAKTNTPSNTAYELVEFSEKNRLKIRLKCSLLHL
jgi:xanthine dehydrogenase/oxidase